MKRNEVFQAECLDLSDKGYGVCRHNGEVVFVPDLLPGEQAEVKIIFPSSRFSIGKVIRRMSDSDERITPVCPVAGQCGGCMLQHMDYEAEKKAKTAWMKKLFKDVEVKDILGAAKEGQDLHYRNKAQFPVQVKNGEILTGFYRPNSNSIVNTDHCDIQSEKINQVYKFIKEHLTIRQAEVLRHIFIRASEKTGQVQVVFVGRANRFKRLARLSVEEFPEIASIVYCENKREDNVILTNHAEVLYGQPWILEECMGNEIELDFRSFFQVNPKMMEKLYQRALDAAEIQDTDTVIDLYSGTGTIGLAAAKRAKKVVGVEIVSEAVENARRNAERNGIENAEFLCMDATDFARDFKEAGRHADVVIVDPPRKGLSEQGINDIIAIDPGRLVYVSCGPQTLRRDLERFERGGWKARWIQPVDMFSRTPNVECVALLEKAEQQ